MTIIKTQEGEFVYILDHPDLITDDNEEKCLGEGIIEKLKKLSVEYYKDITLEVFKKRMEEITKENETINIK